MSTLKTVMGVLVVALVACAVWNGTHVASEPRTLSTALVSTAPLTASRLVGAPTVSAAFLDQVLARAGSPAAGLGSVMYQLGTQYHIDPVFALAFFKHESSFGINGVARETRSVGNIRCTPGWPRCDHTGGYRAYESWSAGVKDWYQLITDVYVSQGLDTVEKVIPVYAPQADNNDEQSYIKSVLADVVQWREQAQSSEVHR